MRCTNGHFYVTDNYKECPYCKKNAKEIESKHSTKIVFEFPKVKGRISQEIKERGVVTEYLEDETGINEGYEATEILTEEDQ